MDSFRYTRSKTVFQLVARRPLAFFLMLLLFVLVAILPTAFFLVATFWLLPFLYMVFASAYYGEGVAQMVTRAKNRIGPFVQSMGIHGLALGALFVAVWWLSGNAYHALVYPFASSTLLANSWFRFCDKFPMELALLIGGFWFIWPAAWTVIRKEDVAEGHHAMLDSNEALFGRLIQGPWLYLLICVSVLGLGWYWLMPRVFGYWESSMLIAVCVILMLFMAGWSFLYGVSLFANDKEGTC